MSMRLPAGLSARNLFIGLVLFLAVLVATVCLRWMVSRSLTEQPIRDIATTGALPSPTIPPSLIVAPTKDPSPTPAGTSAAVPVDLTAFYNCSTSNAIAMGGARNHPNNLASFPTGTNDFAGVRFVVGGMIQLGGVYDRESPGFPVGAKVQQLHLLHGTGGTAREDAEIATLVLHYAGGEQTALPIRYGVHLRDWWYWNKNESPFIGEGTEIVWEGENEFSRSKNCRLRIYKPSLSNPHSDRVVETIAYQRAPTAGSTTPFLLGLSLE